MSKRPAREDADRSTSADELEQRLRHDGTVESAVPVDEEVPEGPLTPDMVEQRQIVEFDEEAERPEE